MQTRSPQIGDKVFLQYGAMCGDDVAEVIAKRETRWGVAWEIKVVDGATDTISRYVGTTKGATSEIGAYLVSD